MKHSLKSSIALGSLGIVFLSFATMTAAQFDVRVNGRVDFIADYNEAYNNTITVTNPPAAVVPLPTVFADEAALQAYYTSGGGTYTETKSTDKSKLVLDTVGRIDVDASAQTGSLDYGAFARLEIDPDAPSVFDTDGHIYIKGSFGKLKIGTDIDAFQDAFDTDHISAGPLSPGKTVSFGGALTDAGHKEGSIVLSTPTISGLRLEGEIDNDSNWGASISYRTSLSAADFEAAFAIDGAELMGGYIQAAFGDFRAMGFYMGDDDKEQAVGGGVGYHLGPVNMSLEGSVSDTNEIVGIKVVNGPSTTASITSHPRYQEKDLILGAGYTFGPGLELSGSVGISDHERLGKQTQAQGRIRLKF
ncbi:MAG: porin [Alphaproteobacteria bacterium]